VWQIRSGAEVRGDRAVVVWIAGFRNCSGNTVDSRRQREDGSDEVLCPHARADTFRRDSRLQ